MGMQARSPAWGREDPRPLLSKLGLAGEMSPEAGRRPPCCEDAPSRGGTRRYK